MSRSTSRAWWASFGLRDQQEWSFGTFAIILLQMTMQYMAAAVVLPDPATTAEPIDLAEHHDRNRRFFFVFILGALATSLVKDWVLGGSLPETANLKGQLIAALLALVGLVFPGKMVQLAVALLAALGLTFYIGQLFSRL